MNSPRFLNAGTVNDAGHSVLPGARIELAPKGPTAVADQQGRFTFQNVTPGEYTITVSYVGLAPFTGALTSRTRSSAPA